MYTLEELQDKTFKELKAIGWQLNVLPDGDKRCRQNWIDAIADVLPPLLALLEVSPAGSDSPGAIEIQHIEPIEPKFGRIVYPTQKPIAQAAKTSPGVENTQYQQNYAEPDRTGTGQVGTDEIAIDPGIHQQCLNNSAKSDGSNHGTQTETLGSQKGDRILAAAGSGQTTERRPLPRKPDELTVAFNDEQRPPNRGENDRDRLESTIDRDDSQPLPRITFSPKFLATYPPYFGEIRHKVEATGQLNLLESETTEEPPDPDDFQSLDAFWEAMARWDAENPELGTVCADSMSEWAPHPETNHYPKAENLPLKAPLMGCETIETIETIETVSCTLEIPPVSSLFEGCANKSSSTCEFLFLAIAQTAQLTTTNLRGPAPLHACPPVPASQFWAGDGCCGRSSSIKKLVRRAMNSGGRAPPGGDAKL